MAGSVLHRSAHGRLPVGLERLRPISKWGGNAASHSAVIKLRSPLTDTVTRL